MRTNLVLQFPIWFGSPLLTSNSLVHGRPNIWFSSRMLLLVLCWLIVPPLTGMACCPYRKYTSCLLAFVDELCWTKQACDL